MWLPLIGPRLHGWLDELVAFTYLLGVWGLGLTGAARVIAFAGAAVHFLLTRLTDYPQGSVKLIPFRTHAFIELGEGLLVLAATGLASAAAPAEMPLPARIFLGLMGASQLVAFGFSDYVAPASGAPRADFR